MLQGNVVWLRSRRDRISRLWLYHRIDGEKAILAVSAAGRKFSGSRNPQISRIKPRVSKELLGCQFVKT